MTPRRLATLMCVLSVQAHCFLLLVVSIGVGVSATDVAISNSTSATVPTATLSGCQVCAATGDCSHAYLGSPGQFCGNWLDRASQRQRCCCARDATCQLSNYACNCRRQRGSAQTRRAGTSWGAPIGLTLGFFATCMGCCCCVWWCKAARFQAGGGSPTVVYGSPVYAPAPDVYVSALPVYAPAYSYGYTSNYSYGYGYGGHHHHHSGMDAGTGALLGGTAGFLGGMAIGHAIGDAGDSGYSGGFAGDSGCYDSGCYDSGCVSGGDF